jgi:predicted transcriptional regulator
MKGSTSQPPNELERFFGALEWRVLNALWAREGPQSVRDLQPAFEGVAYTTLMTTLDRLHRKGVLLREKVGRAFAYRPRLTPDALRSDLAGQALLDVFGDRAHQLKPILSFFVETVSREDREALAALEQLIEERRRAARGEPS